MKHQKRLGALMCAALLFAGCSSSKAPEQVSTVKEVSTTCSIDTGGMAMAISVSAPEEDAEVSKVTFDFTFPMETFRSIAETMGGAEVSDEELADAMKEQQDAMADNIASQLDLSKEDITVTSDDEQLRMTVDINDVQKLAQATGQEIDSSDMIYKDLVKKLSDDSQMKCE